MEDMTHEHHKDYTRGYLTLAVILSVITAVSWWWRGGEGWPSALGAFMGLFFIIFGSFKLSNLSDFALTYSGYDLVAKRLKWWGFVYPFIELGLGAAFLVGLAPAVTNGATLVLMSVGVAGVAGELMKKNRIECACLGAVVKLPLTTVSLVEDAGMAVMAAVMLVVP